MGKLLPVDNTNYGSYSDIVCCVCRKAFGGLTYDVEREVFIHRDPDECMFRLKKSKPL